ncbi:MAG TPA: OmpA family protein [Flavobacterium sp.]|jgi:outer membrane protein OmpA-like peptidoglycan-associated protein
MKALYLILLTWVVAINASAQNKFEVYFDFNKDTPNASSLDALKNWINRNPSSEILKVAGYADSVDVSSYNKEISLRRIKNVLTILSENKISISPKLETIPYGEDFEISDDQAKNRKVVFHYWIQKPNSPSSDIQNIQTDSVQDNLAELFKGVKRGDLIRLRNIHFFRNKEQVIPQSEPLLEQLYNIMVDNPKLSIEIHGHICCNPNPYDTKLSYRRAMFIFNYLLKKGIPLNRLGYMGFGSSEPIYPIPEQTREEQLANRRVEILIIRN